MSGAPSYVIGVPPPGTMIAGKYRVEKQIGSGGMGIVLSATHVDLEIPVAVKLLSSAGALDPDHLARFKREAKAAANIKSEHVVRILDYGALDDATPFIVMEQLEGKSLVDILESGKRVDIADAVDYAIQACEGLAEAHRLGVIHRDVKPGNLFLVTRPSGTPLLKVLDFGAAKIAGGAAFKDVGASTHPSALIGSPRYMAPEQLKEATAIDTRVDVYALGASLYELLSGEPIFEGDTVAQIFTRVLYEPPPALHVFRPDAPPQLEAVVMRCLMKRPEDRFQTMAELAQALAPFAPERSLAVVAELSGGRVSRPGLAAAPFPQSQQSRAGPTAPPTPASMHSAPTSISQSARAQRKLMPVALAALAVAIATAAYVGARSTRPSRAVVAPAATSAASMAAPEPTERIAEPPPPLPPPPVDTTPRPTGDRAETKITKGGKVAPAKPSAPVGSSTSTAAKPPAPAASGNDFSSFGGRL